MIDAYRRWAPVYDHTFGLVAREGRRHAVEVINSADRARARGRRRHRAVAPRLLPSISRSSASTFRPRCSKRRASGSPTSALDHVTGLHEMDAGDLQLPRRLLRHRRRHVRDDRGAGARGGHARAFARDEAGRRGDARQSLQPARGHARLGRAPHGAVRRQDRLALGVRHRRASRCATTSSWSSASRCARSGCSRCCAS